MEEKTTEGSLAVRVRMDVKHGLLMKTTAGSSGCLRFQLTPNRRKGVSVLGPTSVGLCLSS